jgi:sodium/potassium-transporting ATPase subunit alpha
MQLALSSFLQVWFCVTNDVVMSIALMYEKPESGMSFFLCFTSLSHTVIDLMLRRPRNARTDRLTDWRFFFHIYLVR